MTDIDWRASDRCELVAVESSNRHVHLSAEDLARLFGEGHTLQQHASIAGFPSDLALITGFASTDMVHVENPHTGKRIENVRVLGPCRALTQVELAFTDCRNLGIDAPTRISGDTEFSGRCRLINPKRGTFIDVNAAIRAWRHVHMTPAQATMLKVADRDLMALKVTTPACSVTFHDILVRMLPMPEPLLAELDKRNHLLQVMVHLDTDEANAAMLQDCTAIELFRQSPNGSLVSVIRNSKSQLRTNAKRKDPKSSLPVPFFLFFVILS